MDFLPLRLWTRRLIPGILSLFALFKVVIAVLLAYKFEGQVYKILVLELGDERSLSNIVYKI
jgi:hypothetical protein